MASHRFVLQGLQVERSYRLRFHDGSAPTTVMSGRALMQTGVMLSLPLADSSELVLLQRL